MLTDNAWAYTSLTYKRSVESVGARHKRIRPHRPQTNGQAERFIKTLLAEWAYGRLYRTNDERLAELPAWINAYNTVRTHTAPRRDHPDGGARQQPPWESHLDPEVRPQVPCPLRLDRGRPLVLPTLLRLVQRGAPPRRDRDAQPGRRPARSERRTGAGSGRRPRRPTPPTPNVSSRTAVPRALPAGVGSNFPEQEVPRAQPSAFELTRSGPLVAS
ncbi:MAG: integrase core domain-containing protein [Candidatus Limnocylindrales bacterium]